ncbi:MAG: hypothetical protein HY040_00380 [Planctomycetes bacterium]|nr:hypothetical protein [Planctomycetota bacterium]
MRTFQNAIADQLSDRERLHFEHVHLRQSYLGNLPLVLLVERFSFLQGLLWEFWDKLPNLDLVPVLHRLLDYYVDLAVRRREADRRIKSARPMMFHDELYEPQVQNDLFQEIAAEIREIGKVDCGCPRPDWVAELKGKPGPKIRIIHRCMGCCESEFESILTREEFADLGRSIG